MTIKDIQLTRGQDITELSAKCKIRKIGWDRIYFSVKANRQLNVNKDASPFAAALLLPSMKQGEDLIIKGSISKQLYTGMHAIMNEVLQWNIGLKLINIKANSLIADTHKPHKTASFFSGGVDSFYTYLKRKKDAIKSNRVDSFILVNGFDIDLRNKRLWKLTQQNITAIATAEKIELVEVESNIHQLLEPILPWDYTHGGCLAAVGLFLRNEFHRIYIPSTFSVEEQLPWGSHLALDKHWSTEQTRFVHDGTEATRVNKILWQVAKSPIALKHLRVCYKNQKDVYNCGSCDKCFRTMVSLYAAGVLEQTATFPHNLSSAKIAAIPPAKGEGEQIFYGEIQNLQALRDRNLAPNLQKAIIARMDKAKSHQNNFSQNLKLKAAKLVHKAVYIDHVYSGGRTYIFLSGLLGKKF